MTDAVDQKKSKMPLVREATWHPMAHVESLLTPMILGAAEPVVVFLANIGVIIIATIVALELQSLVVGSICAIYIALFAVMVNLYCRFRRRLETSMQELAQGYDGLPCLCILSFCGGEYARDYGVVQATDGYLHFFGSQVEFSVGRRAYRITPILSRVRLSSNPKFSARFALLSNLVLPQGHQGSGDQSQIREMLRVVAEHRLPREEVVVTMPLHRNPWVPRWMAPLKSSVLVAALTAGTIVVIASILSAADFFPDERWHAILCYFVAIECLWFALRGLAKLIALRHTKPIDPH